MEKLKASSRHLTVVSKDAASKAVETANAFLPLMDRIYEGWTRAQAAVLVLAFENQTGEEIADELNLSPSAVSQHLKLSSWNEYIHALQTITSIVGL
jgi:predicted DNA binding protein